MKFTYSVRPLFSQGVRNDALKQFQTWPLVNYTGPGVPHGQSRIHQPAFAVMNPSINQVSLAGPGMLSNSTGLQSLWNPTNSSASV